MAHHLKDGNYPTTTKNGKTVYVHRLIWEEKNGKIPKGMVIHHKNKDYRDNRIDNLQLVSGSEHIKLHPKKPKKRKQK